MKSKLSAALTAAFFSVPMFFVASLIPEHRVEAAVIDWTLHNGSFDDGGAVSGSFVWDTTLETVTSFSFMVSGGNTATFPSITYTSLNTTVEINQFSTTEGIFFCLAGSCNGLPIAQPRELRFSFTPGTLDTPTSSLSLMGDMFSGSAGYNECFNCAPVRLGVAGATFSGTAVPGPIVGAGLPGLILACGGLLALARRRSGQLAV